jgi:ribonuclease HI
MLWDRECQPRQVYVDAAMRNDQGKCGLAAIVCDPRGAVQQLWGAVAGRLTNCEAEYAAAIFALRRLRGQRSRPIIVCTDSLILVDQMQGRAATRAPGLRLKQTELRALLREFANVSFQHIPRERNRLADALANEVADGRYPPTEVYHARES